MDKAKEREKMIGLIINAKRTDPETGSFTEWLADYLLDHGVTVPADDVPEALPENRRPAPAYAQYEKDCLRQIHPPRQPVATAVNLKCVYYMSNRRRVDLVNLMEATCDILVKAGVLDDDCAAVVAGHDGSRVKYSKECPRTEIEIIEMED